MRVIPIVCLSLLASCVEVDGAEQISTDTSELGFYPGLCGNGQINAAELARLDREVRVTPLPVLPITETTLKAGRAFLIHGTGYRTLPAGTYLEAITILQNGTAQIDKWREVAVTSNNELLAIPPRNLPNGVVTMLNLRFEKSCSANVKVVRAYGFNFRQLDRTPPSPLTATVPDATNVTATPLSSTSIQVRWKDVKNGNESGWLIWARVRTEPNFTLVGSTLTDDTDEILNGLTPGLEYQVQINSYDGEKYGNYVFSQFVKMPVPSTNPPPPANLPPPSGGGVVMQPPPAGPEDQSFLDLSEVQFPFNRPPLDCVRAANGATTNCRFPLTLIGGTFDRNGDGVVGAANPSAKGVWPLEPRNNSNAQTTQTEAVNGQRYAPGANLIVLGQVAGTGGTRPGVPQQFVAFHLFVDGNTNSWRVIDIRGGDLASGLNALIMTMDGGIGGGLAGFTLPVGNVLGRITGNSRISGRLSGFDNREMPFPGQPQQPSPYSANVQLTIAAQGAPINFDE